MPPVFKCGYVFGGLHVANRTDVAYGLAACNFWLANATGNDTDSYAENDQKYFDVNSSWFLHGFYYTNARGAGR